PLFMTRWAIRQTLARTDPPVAMLYFHPWEFDPQQQRLPLGRLNRFRTYVGIGRTRERLTALLGRYRFARAVDVVGQLGGHRLPVVSLVDGRRQQTDDPERQPGHPESAVRPVNQG